MKIECVVEIAAGLGEGPFWSVRDACLYWFDMYLPAIYRYRPDSGENERPHAEPLGATVRSFRRSRRRRRS